MAKYSPSADNEVWRRFFYFIEKYKISCIFHKIIVKYKIRKLSQVEIEVLVMICEREATL